jgi:membrane protease YdiL (CAAX protease family)
MSNNNSISLKILTGIVALLSSIFIAFGFFFIASGIGTELMKLYLGKGVDISNLFNAGLDPGFVKNAIFIGQIGGSLIGMVALPVLYVTYFKKELKPEIFTFQWKQIIPFAIIAVSITFVILPLIGYLGDWNQDFSFSENWKDVENAMRTMEENARQITKLIVGYNSFGEMLLVLFTVALLPAIGEELVFRGVLQNSLIKLFGNIHVAVFITAALFSFIHFQFFGFFPRMLLGIVLGYLYITSGNILVSMLMHFINNAMVVFAMNLYNRGILEIDPESSKDLPVESIYLSIILSSALFYLCWRMYKQRTEPERKNV